MPSPVAHSLIGLALGLAWRLPRGLAWARMARAIRAQAGWLLLCVVLANAPDIDFLFGIYRGNLNLYHQTGTHTLVWIALVSLSVWLLVWRRRHGLAIRGLLFILALTGSHLLADICCVDHSPPYGLMLAWPFSEHYWTLAIALFPDVAKKTWADLWTLHNIYVMAVELLITLPLAAGTILWKQRSVKNGKKD